MSTRKIHARHGKGSYWTSMNPAQYDKLTIAQNNYDSTKSMQSRLKNMGKVDCFVEVKIPIDDPSLEKIKIDNQDIYVFKKEMVLNDYRYKIDKFENFKVTDNVDDLGDYFDDLDLVSSSEEDE